MKFFIALFFLVFASFPSYAEEVEFSSAEEEIQFKIENSYKNVFFYSQSMWMSEASFGKYHYWVGRALSYEDCLFIIQNHQAFDDDNPN